MAYLHSRFQSANQMIVYLVIAALGAIAACALYAGTGWILEKSESKEPPIIKLNSFGTLVPILPSQTNVPIPTDDNLQDPHRMFYQDLQSLVIRPAVPPVGEQYPDRDLTTDNGMMFAMRALHYYTFWWIWR